MKTALLYGTGNEAKLAEQYGDLVARYKNAICFIKDAEHIYESMEDSLSGGKFITTKTPHIRRVAGFPLDSLSRHIETGNYYYDIEASQSDVIAADIAFQEFFRKNLF